ncbi:Type I restriction modification DNA specificity domain-containing protein, partial [Candidatus Electrothrix aarhusensis]
VSAAPGGTLLKESILNNLFTLDSNNAAKWKHKIGIKKFEQCKFSDICIESMFGPRFSSKLYNANGNIASLRTTDLNNDGDINLSTMPRAIVGNKNFIEHYLKVGDLVISRSGTCGIAAVFDGYEDIPVVPAAFLIRFRLKNNINPHYLKLFFNSRIGRRMSAKIANGAVQKNLTSKALLKLNIPMPNFNTQNKIVRMIDDLKIKAIEDHLLFCGNLQKSLANQIF